MDDSFTDELIKDLNKSEEDARQVTVSRWAILKDMFEDAVGRDPFLAAIGTVLLVMGPFLFVMSTHNLIRFPNQISVAEEKIFQIFEVRGIPIEVMSLKDPALSEVVEEEGIPFTEFTELATEYGVVYFSQKPRYKMFVVGEHWDIIHYYDNNDIASAYSNRNGARLISPISGIIWLVVISIVYKTYRRKYKEMVGF